MEQLTESAELEIIRATQAANADLLRLLLHIRIAHLYTDELLMKNPNVKDTLKNGSFKVIRELQDLERKILNNTDNSYPWLRNELDTSKLWDISSVIDLMMRIGSEEKDERYEEFLALVINVLTTVFYAQGNRANLHFAKYKAMFQLFIEELKADSGLTRGNFVMSEGKIYLSLVKPEQ